ncbi:dephospho-CoA kinase [Lutibacter profundi]|uniref:Dephospho-CoA kinase n=1 Tax=Lutibacter profundi TaxID=1622118 RepID=A0A120IE30_9FLAO|nr:dephospho-CoA kinase [Lutibacter profundi]AMC10376.1 dephospho-CoA kinase [Lutibacter profundi]
MKIIGLTGGIGSGKSTVLQLFSNLGATVYIADVEAKKLMHTNKELIKQLIALFGSKAYINNELNRKYISSIVFKDKNKLEELNKLVHPKVQEHFAEFVKKCKTNLVIYESAILFESGSSKMCDLIITVIANFEDKMNRIMKRDGVSKQQVLDRMKNQFEDDFKMKKSNFVIRNHKLKSTTIQVSTIYDLIAAIPES